jgi:hypothetical protein
MLYAAVSVIHKVEYYAKFLAICGRNMSGNLRNRDAERVA